MIQKDAQHSLANFSLSSENGEESSLFDFEGKNHRDGGGAGGKDGKAGAGLFLNLPQRERKRNYDVNEYFRGALSGDPNAGGATREKVWRKEGRNREACVCVFVCLFVFCR